MFNIPSISQIIPPSDIPVIYIVYLLLIFIVLYIIYLYFLKKPTIAGVFDTLSSHATTDQYSYFPPAMSFAETDIPKTVYQSWCSHKLPPHMKRCNDTFKEINPEFQYVLYDDTECRAFIVAHFPTDVVDAYDCLIPGAFKSDLWRYCILYIHGGIYIDIKYECVGDFRLIQLFDTAVYPTAAIAETGPKYIHTGLLMTPKGNSLYAKCIDQIVRHVKEKFYGDSPMAPTGPELFGGLLKESEKRTAVLFYYDDYFLEAGEEEMRKKYRKKGYIKNKQTGQNILTHYLEYRGEQEEFSKTGYWMNLWRQRAIYVGKSTLRKTDFILC